MHAFPSEWNKNASVAGLGLWKDVLETVIIFTYKKGVNYLVRSPSKG